MTGDTDEVACQLARADRERVGHRDEEPDDDGGADRPQEIGGPPCADLRLRRRSRRLAAGPVGRAGDLRPVAVAPVAPSASTVEAGRAGWDAVHVVHLPNSDPIVTRVEGRPAGR